MRILLRRISHSFRSGILKWRGNYKSWAAAKANSTGYDQSAILERVTGATLRVKAGEAAFERDGVLFYEREYNWPLTTTVLWIARGSNAVHVIDFGGALGSSYFQNRFFLDNIGGLQWSVVEQAEMVNCGREKIADAQLQFFYSIQESIAARGAAPLLLLSCTLPYLENPHEVLAEIMSLSIPYLVIDNTFFNDRETDRLTVQEVPESIYPASYPCWFLSYQNIKAEITRVYDIICEYRNESLIFLDGRPIRYRGLIARLK